MQQHPWAVDHISASLSSTVDLTKQICAIYSMDEEQVIVAEIDRTLGQRFGVNHVEHRIVDGDPAWDALRMDLFKSQAAVDGHNFISYVPHRSSRHLFANMHDDEMRYVVNDTGDITDGFEAASMPDAGDLITYPVLYRLLTEDLMFHCRNGSTTGQRAQSGRGNSSMWRMAADSDEWDDPIDWCQGLLVPGAGPGGITGDDFGVTGAAGDTIYNWSPYIAVPYVEGPHDRNPGITHHAVIWRRAAANPEAGAFYSNTHLQYWRSTTPDHEAFEAVDGTPTNVPMYLTRTETLTGVTPDPETPGEEDGFVNSPSITVDHLGHPHILIGTSHAFFDTYHAWHDGNAWHQENIPTSIGGHELYGRFNPLWYGGKLRLLGSDRDGDNYRPCLFTPDDDSCSVLGAPTDGEAVELHYDQWLWIQKRIVSILQPHGDVPRTIEFALRPRARIGV